MQSSNNLLVALSRWASGQQENFLSDAFVHLMNALAQEAPAAFSTLLERMTDGIIVPTADSARAFRITSQVSTPLGTPDIEITGPGCYALIEVKDQSEVSVEQLERYSRLIEQSDAGRKSLVLLTRHHFADLGISSPLRSIRWTQIAEWLTDAIAKFRLDPASLYTVKQFLGFLEAKGMSVNRTGWEMVAGIQQFKNFKVLLREAMESAGAHRIWSAYGADFNGWAIPYGSANSSTFYAFVHFEEPEILRFLCKATHVLDQHKPEWVVDSGDRLALGRSLDLSAEEVHFFSRNLDSQRTVLEEFVASCLAQTTYTNDLSGESTSEPPIQ